MKSNNISISIYYVSYLYMVLSWTLIRFNILVFILFLTQCNFLFYSHVGGGQLESNCQFGHHTHSVLFLPMIILSMKFPLLV